MINLRKMNHFRATRTEVAHFGEIGGALAGLFVLPSPTDGGMLRIIATSAEGWDHVSVSRPGRCPNWPEIEYVKRLFFKPNETAMQLHVPGHAIPPNTLSLWRPHSEAIPVPQLFQQPRKESHAEENHHVP